MSAPLLPRAEAPLLPHLSALRRDPWVQWTLVLYALPVIGAWLIGTRLPLWAVVTVPRILLGGVVVGVLWHRLPDLRQREERFFWQDLATASGALLGVAMLQLGADVPYLAVASDLFYIAFFAVFVLALERRPHRHHPWRPSTVDRTLSWPALVVFVACLLAYLVIQPLYFGAYQPRMASSWLAWVLDGFLAIRLALAAIKTSSWRWRNLYIVLCLALITAVADDLGRIAFDLEWMSPTAIHRHLLHGLPMVLLVVATRLRHRRFPADAMIEEERADAGISSPAGQGLVFVLALPILHFSYQGLVEKDLPTKVPDADQELLLLVASLILGALAYFQYQRLRRSMENLRRDRSRFEEDLLESEQDLRLMVEQKQASASLSTFERNFVEIFQRNPDPIAICDLTDGEIVEVNDAFAALFGFRRQEMMGRAPSELGLLAPDQDLEPLQSQLRRQDVVRDHRVLCRHRDGELVEITMSAKRVEIGGQASMLIVASLPQVKAERETSPPTMVKDWLAEAADGAWVVDGDGRVTYWNHGATVLLGWSTPQALGQPIAELLGIAEHGDILARVDADGHWHGTLETRPGNGEDRPQQSHHSRSRSLQCRYLRLDVPGATQPLRLAICRTVDDGDATPS